MAQNPTSPNYDQQIEDLNTQVANLQNLVNALQNQQSNPSTNIPQTSGSSKTTTIPSVSSVQILGTKLGPTGVSVTVGFNTPQGVLSGQIDHYNIWLKLGIANPTGQGPPIVVASSQSSPCTFIHTSPTGSVIGIVGVQTVMKDGQVLAFNLCPTTALTLSPASAVLDVQTPNPTLVANTATLVGNPVTIGTKGTYLVLLGVQATGANSIFNCILYQNGVQVGTNIFTFSISSTLAAGLGMYLISAAAGDTLQTNVKSSVGGSYFLVDQMAILKQFSS